MNIDQVYELLSGCPLVYGVEKRDDCNDVVFHVIVDDPEDWDECGMKCAAVDQLLMRLGIDEDQLMYNDCPGYLNEGSVQF